MPRVQRVEVYDEMARLDRVDFRVFYLQRLAHGRRWEYGPEPRHPAEFVPEVRLRRQLYVNPGFLRRYLRYDPDLLVVTGYYAPAMQLAMYLESARRRPWAFWSEMANTRFSEHPTFDSAWVRDRLRSVALFPLRHFPTEIWAIGTRAQADYRALVDDRVPVRNLPYFANLDRFFAAGERRRPADVVRFVFSGSLVIRKGADAVAEAVARLSAEGHAFELHVAGAGPLQERFDQLPSDARAKVHLHGFMQLDEVPEIYASGDVLLFPSRHDGWGMTLGEGLAAGLPAISTAQTGAAVDMLRDGENGFRLPELTTDRLVESMRFFIQNPLRIPAMRQAARDTARQYTHEVGAIRFIETIERLLDEHGRRPLA
jgi:glycosyltransferase involved in cell wall biosynthesis